MFAHPDSSHPHQSSLFFCISSSIPTLESLAPAAAYMVYTDIQHLRGLSEPADYGSGVEYADGLLLLLKNATPDVALQIGLWLNGTAGCADLLSGVVDDQVQTLYRYLIEDCRAAKVFLRVGYEFDNPDFGYGNDPRTFRQAFRFLIDSCDRLYSRLQCQRKVAFVWHSWGAGTPGSTKLADFYPGNDYVDWIGVSLFSQLYIDPALAGLGNRETVQAVLDFAGAHKKPLMIAESTPFGGVDRLSDPWNDWFVPVLTLIENYDIAMWSYINSDWDAQPMWHNVGFGDTRLSTNATVMHLWKQQVLRNPRFVTQLACTDSKGGRHHSTYPVRGTSAAFLPPHSDNLWSMRNFHDDDDDEMHSNIYDGSLEPRYQVYWIGAVVIVVAVLLCLFRDVLLLCCRRSDEYETLLDEDEDVSIRIVESNRTGYGTLE